MTEQTGPSAPIRCAGCAFWAHFNDAVGICRRRAPRPDTGTDNETVAHWPETFAEEGCGDGVPRAPDTAPQVCGDCHYWMQGNVQRGLEPVNFNDQPRAWWRRAGRCTRHAPLPLATPGARLVWPATHASDACGEGASRGTTPPAEMHTGET